MTQVCSAPGKLFLSGEYAVLRGFPAVVAAVDRRAVARTAAPGAPSSPVLEAARRHMQHVLEVRFGFDGLLPPIRVDAPDFKVGRRKLGLGSSAAVAASACGLLCELAGQRIDEQREVLLEAAIAAHRQSQGDKGSGADVAAAVMGGVFVYSSGRPVEPIDVSVVRLVPVWTGMTASTPALIGAVERFEAAAPAAAAAAFADLGTLAEALAQAYRARDVDRIIAGTARYGAAMEVFGQRAGAEIVTEGLRHIAKLAARCGGAAKPSGAGGGDVAIGTFPKDVPITRFERACQEANLKVLPLGLGAAGLRADS